MTDSKNIPELRFPGFNGEWEEKKLGEMSCDSGYGMNLASKKYDGKNKYIRITDIDNSTNNYIDKNCVSPSGELEDKYLLEVGDILFARTGASVGKTYFYKKTDGRIYYAGFLIRFRISKKYNYKFIFYNTLMDNYNQWVKIMSMRSGQPGINAKEYSSLLINVPSLPEQEKIGSFFYTLDQKLDLQKNRIEELKSYKKGMMQRIFSQEIRFKDENGRNYPDWEEKKLEEILKERKEMLEKGQGVPHASLTKNGIELKTERYDRDFLVRTKDKNYKVSKLGDICYNPSNLKFGVITINTIGTVIFSPIYITFVVNKKISERYLAYYLMRWDFINKVRKFEEGTVYERMAVKPVDFLKYKIKLPSLPEQEKIASLLSALDRKIELEEERLEAFEKFKKGLIQRMFV